MAAVIPRALKLCVGFCPSSFNENVEFYRQRSGEAVGPKKRRPAFSEAYDIVRIHYWQNLSITPKRGYFSRRFPTDRFSGLFEIVADKKGFAAFDAKVLKDTGFVTKAAAGAFEMGNVHKGKSYAFTRELILAFHA
jgi:hypothetical protein